MQRRVPQARRALGARGLAEAVTWSFLPLKQAERFGGGGADLRLLNSIASELDTMRPSILPNLIEAAARNEARGLADPALFEVGPQYKDATPTGQRTRRGRHPPQHGGAAQLGGPGAHRRRLRRQGRCAGRARRHRRAGRQHVGARRARRTGITPAARARSGSATA